MSRQRSKTAVYPMSEGETLVRGTEDPTEALRLIVESDDYRMEDMIAGLAPDYHGPVFGRAAADLEQWTADAAHGFARMLKPQNHRVGWFRKNVQAPGGDYTWMLGEPEGPGPGNFRGVLFD